MESVLQSSKQENSRLLRETKASRRDPTDLPALKNIELLQLKLAQSHESERVLLQRWATVCARSDSNRLQSKEAQISKMKAKIQAGDEALQERDREAQTLRREVTHLTKSLKEITAQFSILSQVVCTL